MQTQTDNKQRISHTPGPWHVNAIDRGRIVGDETEAREREAKRQELRTIAGALAVPGFSLVPAVTDPGSASFDRYYSAVKLAHEDGRQIWLGWTENETRIGISGHLSSEMYQQRPYKATNVSISVAADRAPTVISREIERRLLPDYTDLFNQCKARLDEANAYEIASDKAIREVAKAFGAEVRKPQGMGGRIGAVSWYHNDRPYGDAEASGDKIHLDLRDLSVAQAVAIANLLGSSKP